MSKAIPKLQTVLNFVLSAGWTSLSLHKQDARDYIYVMLSADETSAFDHECLGMHSDFLRILGMRSDYDAAGTGASGSHSTGSDALLSW